MMCRLTTGAIGTRCQTKQARATVICELVEAVQLKIEPVPPKVYLWGILWIPAKDSVCPKSDISAEPVLRLHATVITAMNATR
jgi:hypothetical protein